MTKQAIVYEFNPEESIPEGWEEYARFESREQAIQFMRHYIMDTDAPGSMQNKRRRVRLHGQTVLTPKPTSGEALMDIFDSLERFQQSTPPDISTVAVHPDTGYYRLIPRLKPKGGSRKGRKRRPIIKQP